MTKKKNGPQQFAPPAELETMITEEGEDQSLVDVIALPTYDDLTDAKVLGNVKDVFKGFDYDTNENMGKKFEDTSALAEYVHNSMQDIRTVRYRAEASELLQKGAAMARFWYIGDSMNKALIQGDYGTSAYNKLATEMRKSVPYIYQIRAVATKLTVTDCYLLGIRGCDSTTLRKLAQVKDDTMRTSILRAFVDLVKDTSDRDVMEAAKRNLVAAINMDQKTDFLDVSTSDPSQGGGEVNVTIEYQEVMQQLGKWQKMLKKPIDGDTCDAFYNALEGFYMSETTPDAEHRLDEVVGEAEKTKAVMEATITVLKDNILQIESLTATAITDSEGNKVSEGSSAKASK